MRYLYTFAVIAAAAAGQSSTTATRLADLNGSYTSSGPTVTATKTPNSSSRTEFVTGINGELMPRESVEEKILKQDASGRIVERYVRRFDVAGNPGPVEKTVIEEKKSGDSVSRTATIYRGDLNGTLLPAERSVSQSVTQGQVTNTDTTVLRVGLDGTFAPVEKVSETLVQTAKDAQQQTMTRLERDASGNYNESAREVSERQVVNGVAMENRATYVRGSLYEQTVARTITAADGTVSTTVDVFAPQANGVSADPTGRLALKEQQQITQEKGPGGKTTQTVVTRKPSVSDPNRLGTPQVLSQSVCNGACLSNK